MTPEQIGERAFAKLDKRITDEIFLIIQNDRELMQEYLHAVEEHGVGTVNRTIGKAVKEKYKLTNDESRQVDPVSTLIKSHQEFV